MGVGFAKLLGTSPALVGLRQQLQQLVRRYAPARRLPPMLLLGETGTGKSLIARALHDEGPRAGRPFVDVNCAAIPETLMEAEMFGFERGAFTDARAAKPGLFATADRGTIFLDEIGLLPDSLQAKLLKVVEEQQIRPLGGTTSRAIDVWIVAATSEDLEVAIQKRRFREDLYHRLAVISLRVPPLRERGDDVVLLASHLLARACADYGLPERTLTPDALAALRAHEWPGNIRELSNVIERVALLSDAASVTARELALTSGVEAPSRDDDLPRRGRPPVDDAVATVERTYLAEAVRGAGGNITRAAERLGLTRNTLRYRLRKHGLTADGDGTSPAPAAVAPAAPAAAGRWERRRVAFLRVALAGGDDPAPRARAVLEEAMQKVTAFGAALDGVSPLAFAAVFGLDSVEDAVRHAAHAATAARNLLARARGLDPTVPSASFAIHAAHVGLWKASGAVHVDMDTRPEIWRTLDSLGRQASDDAIVVSAPAAESLRPAFQLAACSDGPDAAWRLLEAERPASRPAANDGFVGRAAEMALLHARLEAARGGRGQVVAIDGEPGIGKSRMLLEFHGALPVTTAHVKARCVSYGRELPLLPVVELVRRLTGVDDDDPAPATVSKVRAMVATLGLADDIAAYLLRLIGVGDGDSLGDLSSEAIHRRTVDSVRAVVIASGRRRPLVVVIEDLHWIDRASETYLGALVDAVPEAPVLLLTTHRTGHTPSWRERSYVCELRLPPLSRPDARRVLDAALRRNLAAAAVPETTAAALLERADGNPFFIEELARAVAVAPETVPESVEAVLLARIDRLPAVDKRLLQAAAVLGRNVPVRLLESVTPEIASAKERLRELQRLEYLNERTDAAREVYRFKHALTQEVAYSSLLADDRRVLHARALEAIEAQHGDGVGEQPAMLAHHAVRAALWRPAVRYLRETAVKAVARSANYEAAVCLEQALAALRRLADGAGSVEEIDLRLEVSLPLLRIAEYRRGHEHAVEAARLAERLGERRRLGTALANRCILLRTMNETEEAIAPGLAALAIANETGDTNLAVATNFFLGTAYATRGDFREAVACYRAGIMPIVRAVTPEVVRGQNRHDSGSRAWLGWLLAELGEFREALVLGHQAVEIAQVRQAKFQEAAHRCLLGNVYLGLGDAERAVAILEPALVVCREYDIRNWLALVAMRLGYAYGLVGRVDEGVRLLEEGAAHGEAINQMTNFPARLATLAECYLLAGRSADARATAVRAAALAAEQRRPHDEAQCQHVLGRVTAAVADDPAAARAHFLRARDLATTLGLRPLLAHCAAELARLDARAGDGKGARETLRRVRTMYMEMEMPLWVARIDAEIAALA